MINVPFGELVAKFVADVNQILAKDVDFMEVGKERVGLSTMMELSARGNLLLSDAGLDNTLFSERRAECDAVILLATNLIWVLSALVYPFMPLTADQMLAQLNAPPRALPKDNAFAIDLLPGHMVGKAAHLFKPIDEKQAAVWKAQFGGDSTKDEKPAMSKKAAAKARKAAEKAKAEALPQTPEVLDLDAKVKAQGETVRTLKGAAGTPPETLDVAVAQLLALKKELQAAVDAALARQAEQAL